MIPIKLFTKKQAELIGLKFNSKEFWHWQLKSPASEKSVGRYVMRDLVFQNILYSETLVIEKGNAILSTILNVLNNQPKRIKHKKTEVFLKNVNLFWGVI